jgi:hypothetical protein
MPASLGPLWQSFLRSDDKPNGSHHRATHWACINANRPTTAPINVDADGSSLDVELLQKEPWFERGE